MKKVDARNSGAGNKRSDKGQKSTEKQLSVKKDTSAKLSLPEKTGKSSSKLSVPAEKKETSVSKHDDFDYSKPMLGSTLSKK